MVDELSSRILDCLTEKPRSISEIARELDEEKYEISKKIEVLEEQGHINTYKIGRSTACIRNDDDDILLDDDEPSDEPADAVSDTIDADAGIADTAETAHDTVKEAVAADEPADGPAAGNLFGDDTDTELDSESLFDENEQPEALDRAAAATEADGDGPRTLGIVSGKGGVGKTVVTLNLGAALMEFGEDVIVMDADAEMPNVGLHLGMYTTPTSLHQVVEQDIHIMSAMHVDKDSGLRVIPTSISAEPVSQDVNQALHMIPDEYTILIDSPPGYERPLERVIDTCDELIFVTTPEIPSVTDTFKLYKEAQQRGKTALGVVVNMYDSPKKHLSVAEVEEALEMPVLGVIEESSKVEQSIFDNQPVVSMAPHAKPSRSFKQIAADLTGADYSVSLMERIKGLIP